MGKSAEPKPANMARAFMRPLIMSPARDPSRHLPFGAGARKCIGDQFAFLEAVSCFATILHRFDIMLACSPGEVGMVTGATIHTEKGLPVRLRHRAIGSLAAEYVAPGDAAGDNNTYPSVAESPLKKTPRSEAIFA